MISAILRDLGPGLLWLSRFPALFSKDLEPALQWLSRFPVLFSKASPRVKVAVLSILGIGILRKANNLLSQAALNNFNRAPFDWRREVVVVTGGSGGLGDLLVRKLAKQSVKVISLDVVPPRKPLPANAYFYETEITSTDSIKDAAQKIRAEHGNPTVLVNNAGIMHQSTILDESEEQIRSLFNINLVALFLVTKEFMPAMIEANHGHIITIASMASFVTGVRNVDYACSKVGALAFHEGLTQELRHSYNARKVRTSVIHPNYVRTALIDRVHQNSGIKPLLLEPEAVVDAILRQILGGNSGQVILPNRFAVASLARGWPSWLQEMLRDARKNDLV